MNVMNQRLGEQVRDAFEETFTLFSADLPSNTLGFVDSKASEIELEIAGRTIVLKQSPGLLLSQRQNGTTGAVVWKVTPLIADWLASMPEILRDTQILSSTATIIELGCGVSALIGIMLSPSVGTYILTDQSYVARTVQDNITAASNTTQRRLPRRQEAKVPIFVDLDWEKDTPSKEGLLLNADQSIELIVACDCIYNEYLIKPLVQTMADVCRLQMAEDSQPTAVLVAQQLRSDSIFEDFMTAFLEKFSVWRVSDDHLPAGLRSGSGYAVHIGYLREVRGRSAN